MDAPPSRQSVSNTLFTLFKRTTYALVGANTHATPRWWPSIEATPSVQVPAGSPTRRTYSTGTQDLTRRATLDAMTDLAAWAGVALSAVAIVWAALAYRLSRQAISLQERQTVATEASVPPPPLPVA